MPEKGHALLLLSSPRPVQNVDAYQRIFAFNGQKPERGHSGSP